MHRKIAEGILTGVHNKTGLDVGEFPEEDKIAGTEQDDPARLAGILSHMVARTFDRIPPLRKISRQAEGADRRSGFVSDALAAAMELYRRNPDRLQELATEYARGLKAKRAETLQRNKQKKRSASASPNGSGTDKIPTIGVS